MSCPNSSPGPPSSPGSNAVEAGVGERAPVRVRDRRGPVDFTRRREQHVVGDPVGLGDELATGFFLIVSAHPTTLRRRLPDSGVSGNVHAAPGCRRLASTS